MAKEIHTQKHMTFSDRSFIEQALADHDFFKDIAAVLKEDPSPSLKKSAPLYRFPAVVALNDSTLKGNTFEFRDFQFHIPGSGLEISFVMARTLALMIVGAFVFLGIHKLICFLVKKGLKVSSTLLWTRYFKSCFIKPPFSYIILSDMVL